MTSLGVTTLKPPGGERCQAGRVVATGQYKKTHSACPNRAMPGGSYCREHLADARARIRAHWARAVKA